MKKFLLALACVVSLGIGMALIVEIVPIVKAASIANIQKASTIPKKTITDRVTADEFNSIVDTIKGIFHDDGGTPDVFSDDKFGFGVESPSMALSLNGAVQIGTTSVACNGGTVGSLRYNNASQRLDFCNGTAWLSVSLTSDCTAQSCSDLGFSCGAQDDGCGGALSCGTCSAGKFCSAAGACVTASCNTNADCNDGNLCTTDTCAGAGTETAACSNVNNSATQACTATLGSCTNNGVKTCTGGTLGACSVSAPTATCSSTTAASTCAGVKFANSCGIANACTGTKNCGCSAGTGKINNFNTYVVSGVTMDTLTWTWPAITAGGYSGANTVTASKSITGGSLGFKFGSAYCKSGGEVQYTGSTISTTVLCNSGYEPSGTTCVATCTPYTCLNVPTGFLPFAKNDVDSMMKSLQAKIIGTGASCGIWPDGCGGTVSCGTCSTGYKCTTAGKCESTFVPCVPESTSSACGIRECGYATNNCGSSVSCGSCYDYETCDSGQCTTTCFIAGTEVEMSDGTMVDIEDLEEGQLVRGQDGNINEIQKTHAYDYEGWMYSINGSDYFVTDSHPFMTKDGWKSFNPNASEQEVGHGVVVGTLEVGDEILTEDGTYEALVSTDRIWETIAVFNLSVDGEHGFYADGYLVHNLKKEL